MTDLLARRLTQALGISFTLEGEIGRGGMGVVYHARDERLKRKVAVKVLPPELAFREEIRIRFLREAETAARLSHPHMVPTDSCTSLWPTWMVNRSRRASNAASACLPRSHAAS